MKSVRNALEILFYSHLHGNRYRSTNLVHINSHVYVHARAHVYVHLHIFIFNCIYTLLIFTFSFLSWAEFEQNLQSA